MRRLVARLLMVAVVAFGVPLGVDAATQDFQVVNETGVEINNLYVSPSEANTWEEDVLGDDTLEAGSSVDISFSDREECGWDLMVADADGNGIYWRGIDLCQVSTVVLHYDGETAWATFD